MKNTFNYDQKQEVIRLSVEHVFQDLIKFKKEEDKASFNS